MRTLEELKKDFIAGNIKPTDWLGDSPNRFDMYTGYAKECDSIVEMGVYTGLCTTAFLLGNPKKLVSLDWTEERFHIRPEIEHNAKLIGCEFQFIQGDSREIDIEETDLLFIDTDHKEEVATVELNRHHDKVRKYIIMHDTTSYPGVFMAIAKFLIEHQEWSIHEHDTTLCGTTVLKRTSRLSWEQHAKAHV